MMAGNEILNRLVRRVPEIDPIFLVVLGGPEQQVGLPCHSNTFARRDHRRYHLPGVDVGILVELFELRVA